MSIEFVCAKTVITHCNHGFILRRPFDDKWNRIFWKEFFVITLRTLNFLFLLTILLCSRHDLRLFNSEISNAVISSVNLLQFAIVLWRIVSLWESFFGHLPRHEISHQFKRKIHLRRCHDTPGFIGSRNLLNSSLVSGLEYISTNQPIIWPNYLDEDKSMYIMSRSKKWFWQTCHIVYLIIKPY